MRERTGVIDLGSNTTRLIVMESEPGICFKLTDEVSEVVRLAQGVGDSGMLQPGPMQRAIEALAMFNSFCRATDVSQVIAVGTSALREARNQAEFLERLAQVSNLQLRVLSTDEEAYYGYLGAVNSLPFSDGFVFDTGGGSTQVVAVNERRPQRFFSAQAGVVRFTERYVTSDPVSRRDFKALDQGAAAIFGELDWFQAQAGQRLIGLGGTVRTLARIDQKRRNYPFDRSHGYVLSLEAVEETIEKLRRSNLRERENISGLNRDRADVILAGAVIVHQLMHQSGFSELMVSGQGLREGLFYEYFIGGGSPALIDNVRSFSVQNLARIYNYEARHAAHVRKLSLSLFDQAAALHGYGEWERELLGYAAILHDIGTRIGYYDHHKHSAYLVFNSGLLGFDHRELVLLAMLVRNHRKGEADTREYRSILAADDPERLARLSSLLRIAEYLERSKSQVVEDVHLRLEADSVFVDVIANGNASVEVWDANRRTNLFKRAFGRDIEIIAPG